MKTTRMSGATIDGANRCDIGNVPFRLQTPTVIVTLAVPFQKEAIEDDFDILTARKIQQRVLDILDEPPQGNG